MSAYGSTTPNSPDHAQSDDLQGVAGIGGDTAPEPVAVSAVVLSVYAIAAYLANRYAPDVFTPELDALVQVALTTFLAYRTRARVVALAGLFRR